MPRISALTDTQPANARPLLDAVRADIAHVATKTLTDDVNRIAGTGIDFPTVSV